MSYNQMKNNAVKVTGTINDKLSYDHTTMMGEIFYSFPLAVKRLSGVVDLVPVLISEQLLYGDDFYAFQKGGRVSIEGQYRTANIPTGDGNRTALQQNVFCRDWRGAAKEDDLNNIYLNGYICKQPNHRVTPLGREICDFIIAVNRNYGKSDYIPCIAWGRTAHMLASVPVGTRVELEGRIQSREYRKLVEEGIEEVRTAHEVSVMTLAILEDPSIYDSEVTEPAREVEEPESDYLLYDYMKKNHEQEENMSL